MWYFYDFFFLFLFSLPLIRHKSTLEKLIYNHRTDEYFKYNTVPPNNENITIFKYLDVSFTVLYYYIYTHRAEFFMN